MTKPTKGAAAKFVAIHENDTCVGGEVKTLLLAHKRSIFSQSVKHNQLLAA